MFDGIIFVKDNFQMVHRFDSITDFNKFKTAKGLPENHP